MKTVVMALALAGCNGGKGPSPDMLFSDANNFEIADEDADMTLHEAVVEANADFCFDWSAPELTTDIRGRPLDPADIEQVLFVEFSMGEAELVSSIVDDNYVPQEGVEPWIFDNTQGATQACASEMEAFGLPLIPSDVVVSTAGRTWMLSLVTFPDGSIEEVQQVMRITADPAATGQNSVKFVDGISTISIQPDLGSPPIQTVAGAEVYTLDWGKLTKDVAGKKWNNLVGDRLFVLRYDGTVEDIEADFLLLDYHAAELYELDVYGKTSADLTEALDAEGRPFPGFTTEATWVVGFGCSQCISPVPVALAVVEVVAE